MSFRKFDWNRARSDFFTLFTDFFDYAAADWTITTTEAGTGSATEAVSASALGGKLVVTNDDADNDKDLFQWAGGSGGTLEQFEYVSGKKLQFVFKGQLSDALDSDFYAGLIITNTDFVAGITDGIFLRKADGDNTLQLVVVKNSTESTADLGELADATEFSAEIYYDGGTDRIEAFLDGVRAGSVPLTNAPDDELLALSFGIQNGEAAAKVLTVDYIGASQER